jgi:predicted protein tyrosine phosphatase
MYRIRNWLWVSGYPLASDAGVIARQQINAMLQLYKPFEMAGVESLYLQMMDGHPVSDATLQKAFAFIKEQHHAGRTLLITCGAGVSRSVTMATAALHLLEERSLRSAYRSIRKQHPDALPDHIHWDSLRHYVGDGPPLWEIWQEIVLDDLDLTDDDTP